MSSHVESQNTTDSQTKYVQVPQLNKSWVLSVNEEKEMAKNIGHSCVLRFLVWADKHVSAVVSGKTTDYE